MVAPKITRGSFRGLAGSTEKTERTRLILLMPRSFRPGYELIIEGIENNEDVFSIYLRPRSDREEIEQAGFDSNFHSMHLIDIAIKDLGIWRTNPGFSGGVMVLKQNFQQVLERGRSEGRSS